VGGEEIEMKLLKAEVDWMQGWANSPRLIVEVDKTPVHLRYRKKEVGGETVYFAENEGFVAYFSHDPKNERGYGGREFDITLEDGSDVTIKGPWSSRCGVMNSLGFTPSVEVILVENDSRSSGAVTVEFAQQAIALINDPRITLVENNKREGEPRWSIAWKGDIEAKPKVNLE
jgi:hypothetical protein